MLFSKKIKIDNDLYSRLVKTAQQAGYSSTEELIRHVLEREVAHSDEGLTDQEQAERQLRGWDTWNRR